MSVVPEKSDVVIIGGGIIGVSTAYYLAKYGISVTLIEKGKIAGEQSSRNWGSSSCCSSAILVILHTGSQLPLIS